MKKRTTGYIILALIIVLAGYLIIRKVVSKQKNKKTLTQNNVGAGGPVSVNGYVVKSQVISESVIASGTALAKETVTIQAETGGRVIGIYFEEGTTIQQGTLMVKLFDADLQAQLSKLKLQEELAIKNEERLRELIKIQAISQQEYDLALNQLNTIRADIDLMKANIQKTEIRAPFTGKAGFRNISTGAVISPGIAITTLQQIQPLRIEFSIPEKYVQLIGKQTEISFTTSGSKTVYKAQIYAVDPGIDVATRSVKIRAFFANKQQEILPGAFIKVQMPLLDMENGIMIPTEAVIPEMKGQKVFISSGGKALPVSVETGMRTDSTIHIISGLKPGDTVITTGIMQLKPELPVKFEKLK